ncbi:MAG: hypothetical protein CVU87_07165, partial [Firmicutes bacterium HGW-Firmicutes-12]
MENNANIQNNQTKGAFYSWRKTIKGVKRRSLYILIAVAIVLFSLPAIPAVAATTLSTGDIVFVGINSDGDDDFSFLLLKDITAGTSIYITDKGWNDSTGFYSAAGDGICQWSTSSDLSAGTIIHIKTSNNGTLVKPGSTEALAGTPLSLQASIGAVTWIEDNGSVISYTGDQIFLYQGTHSAPTFVTGIHYNVEAATTNSNWDGSSSVVQTSALPDQLTNGVNAIWLYGAGPTEYDNFRYKEAATKEGTPVELRAAINNIDNWDVDTTNSTAYTLNPFPVSFTVKAAVPTISSINPTSGSTAGGTSVTISGTSFTGATAVKFGSANASSYNVDSDTQITATSPAGSAGVVDITVTTAGGTSASSVAAQFTYMVPSINSISPTSGSTAGGTSVTISGTNFTGATAVKFGSTNASSYNVDSDTQITATSPAGSAGVVDITVITAGGTSATSAADQFAYIVPNSSPVASDVQISGTVQVGQALAGSYTYTDVESDAEGTSTFQWYRSNDNSGTGKAAIGGATAINYTLVADDLGKYISFQVTPVASAGTTPGTPVESSYTTAVNATPAHTATAVAATSTPAAGTGDTITLTVKKSDNSTDADFDGDKTVTITGYEGAPDATYGSFGGTALEADGSTEVTVTFTDGVGTAALIINKADEQIIGFSLAGVTTPATNSLTITPTAGAVASLTVTTHPIPGAASGDTFVTQPVVTLKDQYA